MKKDLFVDIITFFFILLFLYTGVAKLFEISTVKDQMLSSPLFDSPLMASIITWALPIGEVLLAIALFITRTRLKAFYATFILMTLFTIYVVVILVVDSNISCSCGGIIEELSPKQHIVFNSACIVLSGVAIVLLRKQQPTRRFIWITGSSTFGLLLLAVGMLIMSFTKPVIEKTGMEGKLLPSFDLLLADSVTRLNTANIPTGKPFIVIGFSPYCTHCQGETRDILTHIQQFKDIPIYYVTPWPFSQMKEFYQAYHLNKYPNIIMGREDTKEVFFRYFRAKGTPYTAVFDAEKRLKVVFYGQTDVKKLAQAVLN